MDLAAPENEDSGSHARWELIQGSAKVVVVARILDDRTDDTGTYGVASESCRERIPGDEHARGHEQRQGDVPPTHGTCRLFTGASGDRTAAQRNGHASPGQN